MGIGMNRIPSVPTLLSCSGIIIPSSLARIRPFRRIGVCKAMAGIDGSSSHGVDGPSSSSAIDFLTLCQRLKTTKRTGWIYRGIRDPESIADHMYRMAAMALIAVDIPGINRDKCIKMAIVHDIAEAIVGDIAPSDGVPKEEKSRRERQALDEMCGILGGGLRADEIHQLWNDYEENSSPEAKIVKDFDKVEMILQALEYETGSIDDRKSSSGYIFHLSSYVISRASKKQSIVTISSTEAKYVVTTTRTCHAVWLCRVLGDIQQGQE